MLKNTEIQDFKNQFHGNIFLREDIEYDRVREIWNRLVARQPFIIACCTGAADVVKAIQFAREHGLEVAIKGGGHHVAGHALCDDGLVIDLSAMKGIRVDPVQRASFKLSKVKVSYAQLFNHCLALKTRIQELAESVGINFVETEEAYTSKSSFIDIDAFSNRPDIRR